MPDNPVIVADVSTWNDTFTTIEVHRLGGRQDGSRQLPDGSNTGGLGITVCGVEQATRGHGWWVYDPDTNVYQRSMVATGRWPICETCNPEGVPRCT